MSQTLLTRMPEVTSRSSFVVKYRDLWQATDQNRLIKNEGDKSLTNKKRMGSTNLLTLSFTFLLMCWVGEKHWLNFNNGKFSNSYWCRVHIFLIDMGANPPLKANGALVFIRACVPLTMLIMLSSVFRRAWAIMSIHKFKSQSATYVNAINIPLLKRYSFHFWHTATSWPQPLQQGSSRKLSVLPSDNDKMMAGLWPRLHNTTVYRRAFGEQRALKEIKIKKGKLRVLSIVLFTTCQHISKREASGYCWMLEFNSLLPLFNNSPPILF